MSNRVLFIGAALALVSHASFAASKTRKDKITFQTSDRCMACHDGLITPSGEDVSIGLNWRSSVMANASRDPYWQASVRRESIDHPESKATIEDDCSICHMPIPRYQAKLRGEKGQIFSHLPFEAAKHEGQEAKDGVTCSVCHQITSENFGQQASFSGNFVIGAPVSKNDHPEYGPFKIERGQKTIMDSSSGGFLPNDATHIRDSELCATCHTLYTKAIANGKEAGSLPEQVPYQEWLHSDYKDKQSCQQCHMPEVAEPVQIAHVLGVPREGMHRHVFVGANFLLQSMLNKFRDELDVDALPQELTGAAQGTTEYLQTKAARISVEDLSMNSGKLVADVTVENLGGHKLPTAYPARRAWIHFTVRDRDGRAVFESGALNPDGSIQGNDNDADPLRYERHHPEITSPDQVEIYESILKTPDGKVTTGLLTANGYLKDNRLLPTGFDKATASADVAVHGAAADDPNFVGGKSRVRYAVPMSGNGPFAVTADLMYQPIGYRWDHNLDAYSQATEPKRFTSYYSSMANASAVMLAHTSRNLDSH